MSADNRIRQARRHAGLSQAGLAAAVGVQRSAVSHWEAQRGKPSANNLRQLALLTGVQFEWLATGRGPSQLNEIAMVEAAIVSDIAANELESRMLELMRRLSRRKQEMACEMVELLGGK